MNPEPRTLHEASARPILAISFGAVTLAAISSLFIGEVDIDSWFLSGALGMLLASFYPASVTGRRSFQIAACCFLAAYIIVHVVRLLRAF